MIEKKTILVVDDEVEMRIAMSATLKRCGFSVDLSHNANDAINKFKKKQYCLVISDMTMPKKSGVELLKELKEHNSAVPVIIMTAHGTIDTAVAAMKHGAFDYILKPFDFDTVVFIIERALTQSQVVPEKNRSDLSKNNAKPTRPDDITASNYSDFKQIITENKETLELLDIAKSIAKSKATVLIQAESGTGKELLAQYIHTHSGRAEKPFIAVNCAAMPDTLLESELFGHKKGSFTGAINDHRGKFEQAHEGTILLDEISEMDLALQAKLLRALQEKKIDRVGGSEPIRVDTRVIATTNRNLLEYVDEGKFREDLYFRLNVIPLTLPPLRQRKDDIDVLTEHFIKKYSQENDKTDLKINDESLKVLKHYNWRGNIRELENVIERAVLLCDGKVIIPENLLMTFNQKRPEIKSL